MWGAHPGFAVVYTEGVTIGPNGLANMEHPIQVLRDAGFDDADAAYAFLMLYHYSIASLLIRRSRRSTPANAPRAATAASRTRCVATSAPSSRTGSPTC